ncbi:ATP-binding protein [Tropicimonas sp. IMCC6043]|uniref:ATP-binding protein n=1 Tax=Tropicimonas sp. IMCC6043 TaxID=2510645 RepID=UPI00101B8029|nr:ATP-binding protein [Tropicimonas sp. IMCC6043]RYH09072.1 ATP-binding protein [Tropicimonas sp. IMCC6043]
MKPDRAPRGVPSRKDPADAAGSKSRTSDGRDTPPPQPARSLSRSIESTPRDVRRALKTISGELALQGIGETDREAIEVVLAECMNNVVEHAFGETPGRRFDLRLHIADDQLFCRVEDRGKPMPGLAPPAGRLPDLPVRLEDLPEGGFGWFLIRELTCDLRYCRRDDRNSLTFQIPLGRCD